MPMFDFDRSWREAAALIEQVKEKVAQIEDEQSTLDVKRDLARWLEKFEALSVKLAEMREDANRGGG
ncbi:MAG: hypothetical protein K2X62_06100 [Beijerinckiaceae bacterium]|nr:hypothetical protein [Beijerinckiaceae bacterium]MDO9443459.1 hypothetical protein [Beijerinckiaceae bacterium]